MRSQGGFCPAPPCIASFAQSVTPALSSLPLPARSQRAVPATRRQPPAVHLHLHRRRGTGSASAAQRAAGRRRGREQPGECEGGAGAGLVAGWGAHCKLAAIGFALHWLGCGAASCISICSWREHSFPRGGRFDRFWRVTVRSLAHPACRATPTWQWLPCTGTKECWTRCAWRAATSASKRCTTPQTCVACR